MVFNSWVFVLFALVFYGVWFCIQRQTYRLCFLVIASLFFYGYWDWRFLFLLIGSGMVDFYASLGMAAFTRYRRMFLVGSLLANLGSLGFFKYSYFLMENAVSLFELVGVHYDVSGFKSSIILPLGISFYTFQSLSYTLDVYHGKMQPTRSILHFFAYLTMFPQLVAGPIERARSVLPQLEDKRNPSSSQCWEGWQLIVRGFFKKCVIADNLAPLVNQAFEHSNAFYSGWYWWLVIMMFAFQIYGDFSGYSDIARGLALLMGIDLMVNFNHPYLAGSFTEFWKRWHISLSSWFAEYVYIPLGGNRRGKWRTYLNLWLTMLLSGLWHGASLNFLVWGIWHASMLTVEKTTNWPKHLAQHGSLGRWVGVVLVFGLTLVSWVFFRAGSLRQAGEILGCMFSPTALWEVPTFTGKEVLFVAVLALGLAVGRTGYCAGRGSIPRTWHLPLLEPVAYGVLLAVTVYMRGPGSEFIYFQF